MTVGWVVLSDALWMVCAGLAIGSPLAFWGKRLAASLIPDLPEEALRWAHQRGNGRAATKCCWPAFSISRRPKWLLSQRRLFEQIQLFQFQRHIFVYHRNL